ncbi:unnamed protein product [Nesidiocoris tenuis]|uniref:Uncharacterized protein n=1 Tax=Nesidiocoris tenuis TaxID=355587 RepID=A0A6H5GFG7_9HEMI|nr:unnamed protein product [Nesidiocoris tenuis]
MWQELRSKVMSLKTKMSDVHEVKTRASKDGLFQIPTHRTAIYNNSFTIQAIKIYNSFPQFFDATQSTQSFKNSIKTSSPLYAIRPAEVTGIAGKITAARARNRRAAPAPAAPHLVLIIRLPDLERSSTSTWSKLGKFEKLDRLGLLRRIVRVKRPFSERFLVVPYSRYWEDRSFCVDSNEWKTNFVARFDYDTFHTEISIDPSSSHLGASSWPVVLDYEQHEEGLYSNYLNMTPLLGLKFSSRPTLITKENAHILGPKLLNI